MAQYQHLPIYKVTYELLQQITKVTKDFPRDYKHSLGAKLREEVVDLALRLHPNKTEINRIEGGINFLGYIARPYARYVRQSTLRNARQKVMATPADADPVTVRAMANSYFGLMGHANAWRERKQFAGLLRKHGHRVSHDLTRVIL